MSRTFIVYVLAITLVCFVGVFGVWQVGMAAGDRIDIADPAIGAGWENLLAGIPGGTQLRAGVELGGGCKMSQVELGGGYLNISVHGPYAIGNPTTGKLLAAIVCDEPFSGIFAYGDNDHDPLSEVCFDDSCWTPTFGADTWHYREVENVRYIVINSYGDSGFWTLFKNTNGTPTPTPVTPTATPTSTSTATSTSTSTATPTATPTATIGSDQFTFEQACALDEGVIRFRFTNLTSLPQLFVLSNGSDTFNDIAMPGVSYWEVDWSPSLIWTLTIGGHTYALSVNDYLCTPVTPTPTVTPVEGVTDSEIVPEPVALNPRLFLPLLGR